MTRKPMSLIAEKGVLHIDTPRNWWDKVDANGDYSLIIFCLTISPVVLPLMYARKLFRSL